MNRQTAVRILVGGAVAGALGITTILAGAQPPSGRYGGVGGYGGYGRPHAYTACKPGWGFGDRNHCHSGPPGLVGKQVKSSSVEPLDAPARAAKGNAKGQHGNQGSQAQPNQVGNSRANPASGGQPNPTPGLGRPAGGSPAQANPQPKPDRQDAPAPKPVEDDSAKEPETDEVEDDETDDEETDDDSAPSDNAKKNKDNGRGKQG